VLKSAVANNALVHRIALLSVFIVRPFLRVCLPSVSIETPWILECRRPESDLVRAGCTDMTGQETKSPSAVTTMLPGRAEEPYISPGFP
jgi:hypothetical protein